MKKLEIRRIREIVKISGKMSGEEITGKRHIRTESERDLDEHERVFAEDEWVQIKLGTRGGFWISTPLQHSHSHRG